MSEGWKHTEEELAEFFLFLDDLRASARTNMFGAGPYLRDQFRLTRDDADRILGIWFKLDRSIPAIDRARSVIAKATGEA